MNPTRAALRRNGKPQACEPCRKGKMRCDHAFPYCGRCVRRKLTSRCVYHPAPMTKTKSPDTSNAALGDPAAGPNGTRDVHACHEKCEHPYTHRDRSPSPRYIGGKAVAVAQSRKQSSLFKRSLGTYGSTSFSDTFVENESRFGPELLDVGGYLEEPPQLVPKQKNTHLCVKTLRSFPRKKTCERLLENYDSLHNPTIPQFMVRHAVDSIWSAYPEYLNEPRDPDKLMKLVDLIYMNERKPLRIGPNDPYIEKIKLCTGANLKWEMLGVVFTFFGLAFMQLQDWDPIFAVLQRQSEYDKDINRAKAAFKMKKCADACLKQCAATDTMNDIVICLMLNNTILESICVGDESYQIDRRGGVIMSAVMAMGLHRLPETDYVTSATEMQRALFAAAYFIDKSQSSFNGRPPLLSRHYCHFRMPLDLSYEALGGSQAQLDAEVARLDGNGWNTDGAIHQRTVNRAFWFFAPIREEILEISLGVNVVFDAERVNDLLARLSTIISSFPPQLQFLSLFPPAPTNPVPQGLHLYTLTILHLEYLQLHFLLHRLLHKHTRTFRTAKPFFLASLTTLSLLITLWSARDQLSLYVSNFEWLIVSHGIPAAGVLCGKALRHARDNEEDRYIDEEDGGKPWVFPKARVVRDLTVFGEFLNWVRRTDGNYMLCRRLRRVVQRIVDGVLEPDGMGLQGMALGGGSGNGGQVGVDGRFGGVIAGAAGLGLEHGQGQGENSLLTPEDEESDLNGDQDTVIPDQSQVLNSGFDHFGNMTSNNNGFGFFNGAPMGEMGDSPSLLDEGDCMDWLNMVDWTQGPWADFQ